MPARTPSRRRAAALVAAVSRHHGPADPRLPGLRRDLAATELEERLLGLRDRLTAPQRARLAALLTGPAEVVAGG